MGAQNAIGDLGGTFRNVRQRLGMTLEAVAKQAEVTKGYLSKVESGRAMPSIAVISKLADVFGLPLSEIFMPEGQRKPISLVRADERAQINKNGTELGYIYEFATMMKRNPRCEVFFLTLPVLEGEIAPRFRHKGEEINLVLEGRMRFRYGGVAFDLGPGDVIQFDSEIEHYGVAIGDQPAKLFVVTIPDRSERGTKS